MAVKPKSKTVPIDEKKVEEFIDKGSKKTVKENSNKLDHRLTLRIPKWLMELIDEKRATRIGNISRNSLILEELEKSLR